MRDIFEYVRKKLGIDFISDLKYHQTAAENALDQIDISKYPEKQINDFLTYIGV